MAKSHKCQGNYLAQVRMLHVNLGTL